MNFAVIGINHERASVDIREKLAVSPQDLPQLLKQLLSAEAVKGAVVLSTCNRVEFYVALDSNEGQNGLACAIEIYKARDKKIELNDILYVYQDKEATMHLLNVVSGIDSLVTGETQIVSQVRHAYQCALQYESTCSDLNKLFERAFEVAKKVRTQTEVGKGSVSVGSVAVRLAKQIFDNFSDKTIVSVGAGEIAELVLTHLREQNPHNVYIVNRTYENAKKLETLGLGTARPLHDLPLLLESADIVITSVSGQLDDLTSARFEPLLDKRSDRKLFLIDLGVPRNIDEKLAQFPMIYLFNIDDLQEIAHKNIKNRDNSHQEAKNIIEQEVALFYSEHVHNVGLPTIALLAQKFEQIRYREQEKTLQKMSQLNESDRVAIDKMTKAIVTKILHDPILTLSGKNQKVEPAVVSLLKKVFRLDDENE